MIRNALILMCVTALIVCSGVMMIDDSDAAVNIGLFDPDNANGDSTNQSNMYDAYGKVDASSQTFDEVFEGTMFVITGCDINYQIRSGNVVTETIDNVGLTLTGGSSQGWTISGTATDQVQRVSTYQIRNVSSDETKIFSFMTLEDETVYADGCTLSVSPSDPEPGETFTVTANFTPSNATYKAVEWEGLPSGFVQTGSTSSSITGYISEPGNYRFRANYEPELNGYYGHKNIANLYVDISGEYEYFLIFNKGNGEGGPSILESGPTTSPSHTFQIPQSEPTWPPYHDFLGWSESENDDTPDYQPGDYFRTLYYDDPIGQLYAVWGEAEDPTIVINGPTSVEVGDGFSLSASIAGGALSDRTVTWSIRSGSGLVDDMIQISNTFSGTAIAAGTLELRATSNEISSLYEDWTITIEGPDPVTIEITGPNSVQVGDDFTLVAQTQGGSGVPGSDSTVTWSVLSGSELIDDTLQLNNNFIGTAAAPGVVTFRATSVEDQSVYEDWTLTIEAPDPIVITIHGETSIEIGDEFDIYATVSGGSGGESSNVVEWSTVSGSEFISLAGIQVPNHWTGTGVSPGQAVFRATSVEDPNVYEEWTLTIEEPDPIVITIMGPTSVEIGERFVLRAQTTGGTGQIGTDQTVSWSIRSGAEFVTLDQIQVTNNYAGVGAAAGVTVFRATSIEDPDVYEEWTLTVGTDVPLQITISGESSIQVGESFDISALVAGGEVGGSTAVTWTVQSGGQYVDLDDVQEPNHISGLGAAVGTVTFRATSQQDTDVYEEWTLEVVAQAVIMPTSISITGPGNVMLGETGQIFASVLPTNAPNRGIIWTIETGNGLIEYETGATYRGGVLDFGTVGIGTVTIRATSTADNDVYATYTLTILNPNSPENQGTLNVNNIIKALADAVFAGNTAIAGIVVYAAILLVIFLLIREPLPVVLISIPVTLILRLLRVLDNDLTILLIIIAVLGLAMLARNMWRD